MNLLEANIDKINWDYLPLNPNIFEIDKTQYKINITEKANILDNQLYRRYKQITYINYKMEIPLDILKLVSTYLVKPKIPKMKLLDWIPIDKLDWYCLSGNPNAIYLLEANPDKIRWSSLSRNPNAIHLLEQNPDKINWDYLVLNPNSIPIYEANPSMIEDGLSLNPNAVNLLEANPDEINWHLLSGNPNAITLLEANPDKINWYLLSLNPNAIHLLEANPDKIYWENLSQNPNALHLLKANINKIKDWQNNWKYISLNPNIFEIDKTQYKVDIIEKAHIIDKLLYKN